MKKEKISTIKAVFVRIFKIMLRILEVLLALIIVGGGLTLGRLYTSPVEIKEFLPTLEKHALPADSGLSLKADSLTLHAALTDHGILHIAAQNLTLIRADGKPILRLPEVDISYYLGSILILDYTPDNTTIKNASLHLNIDKEGSWHLYGDSANPTPTEEKSGPKSDMGEADATLIEKLINQIFSFESLSLVDARVVIHDQQKGEKISIPTLNFLMERQPGFNHAIQATATVNLQESITEIKADAQLNRMTRRMNFDITFDTLDLKKLARVIPVLTEADLIVNGHITGVMNFGDTCSDIISCLQEIAFHLESTREGSLNLPAPLTNLYLIQSATINGAIGTGLKEIKIAKSKVQLKNGPEAQLTVDITGLDQVLTTGKSDSLKITLKSDISSLGIEQVPDVWPVATGPDAHAWVKRNLSKGTVEKAIFTLYFNGADLTDLYGELPVHGIRVRYLDEMTPVDDFAGLVQLWPDRVLITGKEGKVGNLKLTHAIIDLTDLKKEVSNADITLNIQGPIREAMSLIAEEPLAFPQMFGLDPAETGGQASVQAALKFPLIDNLTTAQVQADVTANLTEAVFPTPVNDLKLTDGKLDLIVNNQGLTVQGTGKIANIPLDLVWTESFTAQKPEDIKSEYRLNAIVQANHLKPFISHAEAYLDGSFVAQGDLKETVGKIMTGSINIDMDKTNLTFYPLSIDKKTTLPLTAAATIEVNPQKGQGQFELSANGQTNNEKEPNFELALKGNWKQEDWDINLTKLIAPQTDTTAHLTIKQGHKIALTARGKALNLSGIHNNPTTDDETDKTNEPIKWPTDIQLDISLDRLQLDKDLPLHDTKITGKKEKGLWKNLSVTTMGNNLFQIVYLPQNNRLTAKTENFGDLLARLGLTNTMQGGVLNLKATQQETGGFNGTLDVKDLDLKDPSFLLQAFTILGIVDAIRGKDLNFETVSIPFELQTQPTLSARLKEAYMTGTNLGITFDGTVTLNSLNLVGSVIPAYAINSLPGKIPVVGVLFKDGESGGLMGVKYEITGKPSHPEVSLNPLGSIAPGILGKLFQ